MTTAMPSITAPKASTMPASSGMGSTWPLIVSANRSTSALDRPESESTTRRRGSVDGRHQNLFEETELPVPNDRHRAEDRGEEDRHPDDARVHELDVAEAARGSEHSAAAER